MHNKLTAPQPQFNPEKYVMHSFAYGFHSNMVLCVRGQVSDQTGMGPKSKPNLDIFWAQKGPKYPPIVMVHNSYCQAQPQPQLNWAQLVILPSSGPAQAQQSWPGLALFSFPPNMWQKIHHICGRRSPTWKSIFFSRLP